MKNKYFILISAVVFFLALAVSVEAKDMDSMKGSNMGSKEMDSK